MDFRVLGIYFGVFLPIASMAYTEKFYLQTIDHFTFQNHPSGGETFLQRYFTQEAWWATGKGPIFFYCGNEAPIDVFINNTGFLSDVAPHFKALVVYAEHRYYGKSLPFGADKSFTQPYISYLTVEQTMADYVVLLDGLKRQLNASGSPVIAFGGSYGGMLAAYMRFKYPNVVAGSIASSAPIYLVAGQSDRSFFFEDVTRDYSAIPGCEQYVRQAFIEIKQLSKQGRKGLDTISSTFSLCEPLNDTAGVRHLIGWIRNAFTTMAMFDYPYPTKHFQALPAYPVQEGCKRLLAAQQALTGLANLTHIFYGELKCHDIWSEYVECADPTGCGTGPTSKAWDYQACTEMIMPGGSNNVTDFFPPLSFTLEERDAYCNATWGVKPRNNWLNIQLWGKDISSATNIVFSNGDLDPWHRGGVLANVSDSLVAIMIKGGAHFLDLSGYNKADPSSVIRAREIEVQYIQQWIQEATRPV